ncbi:MAG: redoxin domain-containing protein [Rickettsiales bacterium]|nr:redoxin domain-containing protein [Rickettsiales bacterium]
MKTLLNLVATFALIPFVAFAEVEIGKASPDFSAVDTNGAKVTLSELKDEIVVLEWTNHGCPFVKKFYSQGDMQATQKDYTAKGVKWVRIISSAVGKQGHVTDMQANEIAKEQGAAATHTIRDESGEIGRLFGAKTTPHMFVIDKAGNVAYQGAMDDIRSPSAEKIAEATPHLKNALNDLLAGNTVQVTSSQPYGCSVKY